MWSLYLKISIKVIFFQKFNRIKENFRVLGTGVVINDYSIVTARSSGILKAKQKLGVTFNSDKLGGIDFTKFSKLSMCSAGAGWYNGLGFLLGTAHGQF